MPKILDLRNKKRVEFPAKQVAKKPLKKEVIQSVENRVPNISPLPRKQISPHISWEAPSFYFNPQKRYLGLIIIALLAGGGALFFFQKDTLTAIFLILSSLVLILYSNKEPGISKIAINQAGVSIGEILYSYKELKSFWVYYNPGAIKELSLEPKKWYIPYVKISIEDKDPLAIRSLLINFLPEKEHENSLVDIIARKIGL